MKLRSIIYRLAEKIKGDVGMRKKQTNTKITLNTFENNEFLNFKKPELNQTDYTANKKLKKYLCFLNQPRIITLKFKRFLIARGKKLLKKIPKNNLWVRTGTKIFLFKKALNSRMGKGGGSFYSSRRLLKGGSALMKFAAYRNYTKKLFHKYIQARIGNNITWTAFDNTIILHKYTYRTRTLLKKKTH